MAGLTEADVRSAPWEDEFLKNVASEAARRFGINVDGFEQCVRWRLELGKQYGGRFLSRDNVRDLLEEAWDVPAYAMLEAQRRMAEGVEDDGQLHHLFEAAVHAAAVDWHARQARE